MFHHCVENCEQFSHACDQGGFFSFACGAQTHIEAPYGRVIACGYKRAHVQYTSDLGAAAPDSSLAAQFSAVTIKRRHPGNGGNLFPVQLAEFRQVRQQSNREHRPNARNAFKEIILFAPDRAFTNGIRQAGIDACQLPFKPFYVDLKRFTDALVRTDETVLFGGKHIYELTPSLKQRRKFLGVGIRQGADMLAQKLGVAADSLIRAQAGVRHVLQEISSAGHCAEARKRLAETAARLLEIPEPVLESAIDHEVREGNLIEDDIDGESCLYLAHLFRAETGVADNLTRLLKGRAPWAGIDTEKAIPWVENKTGLKLSESQQEAVRLVLNNKATVITGGPGVGKTTIVKSILKIILAKKIDIAFCAPTGRAAKRLSEATGMEAKTVHRLLEYDPMTNGFKRGKENPLDASLVVMDEASMADVALMNRLLSAIPDHAGLLIVGDIDQLPSVGPGAVLSDIIESGVIPTVRLMEIFRQAAASKIIVNAHRINRGEMPMKAEPDEQTDFYFIPARTPEEIHERLISSVTERIPKRFGLHPVRDIQVLTPMNRGSLGVKSLNIEIQKMLNPQAKAGITRFGTTFAPGDKVMQTVNNYDKEVFNGDIGWITGVDSEEGLLKVNFDGRPVEYEVNELDELSLAYAATIHKSQGSEYPAVVIPLSTEHYVLLERNLLYTAVTRGKRLVVIIGQPRALEMAVRNRKANRRVTKLMERLKKTGP